MATHEDETTIRLMLIGFHRLPLVDDTRGVALDQHGTRLPTRIIDRRSSPNGQVEMTLGCRGNPVEVEVVSPEAGLIRTELGADDDGVLCAAVFAGATLPSHLRW